MASVILSGPGDALGRRVADRLRRLSGVDRVITLDGASLLGPDLKRSVEGTTTAVHLLEGVDETRSLLDAAGDSGVQHLVLLSSATVYGAWPGNPVPLTEDATLRPNPELDFAVRAAERERLAAEWKFDHPGTTVAVLRPATPVAEDADGWLAHGLQAAASIRAAGDDDPPAQFIHLDDLAAAVAVACDRQLDGPFNVAPDGWVDGDALRALEGRPRLRLPDPLARRLSTWRLRLGLAPVSTGLVPYTRHPWVVANDRLRAAGWAATYRNEEAFVAGTRPVPWATISPRRRQELALGSAVVGLVGVGVGVTLLVRRLRRR
jgi:nucleoside-diphosphate-sugar epimerase